MMNEQLDRSNSKQNLMTVKDDRSNSNKNLMTVKDGGNSAFSSQNGSQTVTDSQGFVNGPIDKSNHHVDNSVNQVKSFEICAVSFSFKHIILYYV